MIKKCIVLLSLLISGSAIVGKAQETAPPEGNTFQEIVSCDAIGYSPFGIDGIEELQKDDLKKAYDILEQLSPFILKAQQKGTIAAAALSKDYPEKDIHLGDYILHVKRKHAWDTTQVTDRGYALVIALSTDTYLIAGNDFQIDFSPAVGKEKVGIDYIEEGHFYRGEWQPRRRLNGDEISSGTGDVVKVKGKPVLRKVRVYQYK